uniref:Immunoglobulin-binding protein 1 n=1 Tax=Ciona savignyi TaxID=51511 RepID=H2Y424_CIOSA
KNVEQLGLFSHNEDVDEIATQDLRYLLLGAISGHLTMKKKIDLYGRVELLRDAREFYVEFLKLCRDYGGDFPSNPPDMKSLTRNRDAKIAKYKQSKALDEQISGLAASLDIDENCRRYWLLVVERWLYDVVDEVSGIDMEITMLSKMHDFPRSHIEEERKKCRENIKPVKPFVLTKDKLQAAVFGAGYPSLPTVTLDEYYEREVAAGRLPAAHEDPTEDQHSDDDFSDKKLLKQREMDDWKDDHRRGAGNRKNMG